MKVLNKGTYLQALEQQYAQACQELGHLHNNLRKVKARIAELETIVDSLESKSEALKTQIELESKNEPKQP